MKTINKKNEQKNTTSQTVNKNWFQKHNHITGHRVGNGYNRKK